MHSYDSIDKSEVFDSLKDEIDGVKFIETGLNKYIIKKSPYTGAIVKYNDFGDEKIVTVEPKQTTSFFINKVQPVLLFLIGIVPLIAYLVIHSKQQKNFKTRIIKTLEKKFPINSYEYDAFETRCVMKNQTV